MVKVRQPEKGHEVIGCPYCAIPVVLDVSKHVLVHEKVGSCKDCNISIKIVQRL